MPSAQLLAIYNGKRDARRSSSSTNEGGNFMDSNCECPRCGSRSFETLATYSHCPNCLYFEDYYEDTQSAAYKAIAVQREMLKIDVEQNEESEDEFDLAG